MEEEKMNSDDWNFFCGVVVGILLMGGLWIIVGTGRDNSFSKDTMNDICYNLNQTEGIEGHAEGGKLICEVPSFDSTQNIQFRSNKEVE